MSSKEHKKTDRPPRKAVIVGAFGYSGLELIKLCLQHPEIELIGIGGSSSGQGDGVPSGVGPAIAPFVGRAARLLPWLTQLTQVPELSTAQLLELNADIAFLATPAEISARLAPEFLKAGTDVIDLSGAFRIKDKESFKRWYGFDHPSSELLADAVYGLSPFAAIERQKAHASVLVANPGCYATAVSMALLPLFRAGLIDPDSIVIDAKSGSTGAGKKPVEHLLLSELAGEIYPYRVGKHQHTPEIEAAAAKWGGTFGKGFRLHWATHLLPVPRGILVSAYGKTTSKTSDPGIQTADLVSAYDNAYQGYPLVRVAGVDGLQSSPDFDLRLAHVVGQPGTLIHVGVQDSRVWIFCMIDNLMKGAAGQAIENANALMGLAREHGLYNGFINERNEI